MLSNNGKAHEPNHVGRSSTDWNIDAWASTNAHLIQSGKPQHALALYKRVRKDVSALPNAYSLVALLKACAKTKDVKTGLQIHVDADARGLIDKSLFIGSSLIDMYVKCGLLKKAQQLFDRLPLRNVVLWTALISGYADNGNGEKALHCFEGMVSEGVFPNAVTFTCSLKACSQLRVTDRGQEIHAEVERRGLLETDSIVGNALIDMYAKCGLLELAQQVFDKLPNQDLVSWNTLIAGYASCGYGSKALQCLEQMQLENVTPDYVTYLCSLKACASVGAIHLGQDLHSEIERCKVLKEDLVIGNALVEMYACCGCVLKAQEVFDKLSSHDVISWTSLISGFVEHGYGDRALECFEQMQLKGVPPDAITFVWILKACADTKTVGKGQEIHAEIERRGLLVIDALIGNTVVDLYIKCSLLDIAQQVFDTLPVQNLAAWNALIGGYVDDGSCDEALRCFEEMESEGISPDPVTFICILKACGSTGALNAGQKIHAEIERRRFLRSDVVLGNALLDMYAKCGFLSAAREVCDGLSARNVISWTTLIKGYAEHGHGEEALQCLKLMQCEGVPPNSVTFVCSLKACSGIGAKDKGRIVHIEIERRGLLEVDPVVGNTLVYMYARFGDLAAAQLVFNKLSVQDIVSWTALMAGYAQVGESKNVFNTFDRMIEGGVAPNAVTFVVVLRACSQTGSYSQSQTFFEAMSKNFGIVPGLEHHACVVDLLGRVGHLNEAVARFPTLPNLVLWHSLLGACGKWGNVKCGAQAFEHALWLDNKDATAYAMMSDICAGADLHHKTACVQPTGSVVVGPHALALA
ncbi:hypothetical protein GOP47_0022169 [Adiantum capillus-veneris]|uniref:Pentatricopeptide repeat-containing protein n=1 Tax=Adiantum capillus-veneris TaxID=13818 RepID=A0A9D4Z7L0_ADICA|nr:hypothetical protein GOP47_0022169 [Adiantum capillus-veneris]